MSSTGGNRSWSEEEENYLLQTRMQKMPYKHIAAHLKKTELACRLHYHQLSHGSHRRKRTASVSSSTSSNSASTSPNCPQYALPAEHDEYPAIEPSRHSSPVSYGTASPHPHPRTNIVNPNNSPTRNNPHKILLPKPRPLTPSHSPEPHTQLRINTTDIHHHSNKPIDTDRLRAIYEARRASFWAAIAADYGADVSPAQLEGIWCSGTVIPHLARPPTPDASPDGSITTHAMLKPSPFAYPASSAASATEPQLQSLRSAFSPLNVSAVSAPERTPFVLPMPVQTPQLGRLSRSNTWGSTVSSASSSAARENNVPIAALLTEDRNPRGEQDVSMRD
ncbi:hypothetical protein K432DRAFT_291139 [Lepidopterella palustris CBS 459.81]|uniref:Myb-like domain-containing protein n=1 Tax=Lepidopterella palustris CBS 459.81 TaxID=1314670 RepID=A0A8E2EGK1_9PEZI|nr:hypothetical protein K432DRAFT_291139 [Lepidopterella palustris CBS 459.81]